MAVTSFKAGNLISDGYKVVSWRDFYDAGSSWEQKSSESL